MSSRCRQTQIGELGPIKGFDAPGSLPGFLLGFPDSLGHSLLTCGKPGVVAVRVYSSCVRIGCWLHRGATSHNAAGEDRGYMGCVRTQGSGFRPRTGLGKAQHLRATSMLRPHFSLLSVLCSLWEKLSPRGALTKSGTRIEVEVWGSEVLGVVHLSLKC